MRNALSGVSKHTKGDSNESPFRFECEGVSIMWLFACFGNRVCSGSYAIRARHGRPVLQPGH
jgi:hypothetical protein